MLNVMLYFKRWPICILTFALFLLIGTQAQMALDLFHFTNMFSRLLLYLCSFLETRQPIAKIKNDFLRGVTLISYGAGV